MNNRICEKGTLTALDKSHLVKKITQTYNGLPPVGNNHLYKSATKKLLENFERLEIRQGRHPTVPNWPEGVIAKNSRDRPRRPQCYNQHRNLSSYMGGDNCHIKLQHKDKRPEEVPIVGLGTKRPLAFITECHHLASTDKYSLIILFDGWRENFKKVNENLLENHQEILNIIYTKSF